MEYYATQDFSGINALTSTASDVNFNWGLGAVFSTYVDHVSVKMYFRLLAPVTGTYTFYTTTDDSTTFYIDGVQILRRLC